MLLSKANFIMTGQQRMFGEAKSCGILKSLHWPCSRGIFLVQFSFCDVKFGKVTHFLRDEESSLKNSLTFLLLVFNKFKQDPLTFETSCTLIIAYSTYAHRSFTKCL